MAEQNGMEKPDLQALPTINDRMTFSLSGTLQDPSGRRCDHST